ncbi:MAG: 2Fe-2S iron-sulfur cluster-binding protein [Comamonadaceae bacterium]|nr:2Fe-2S iron-sulfur cluster binding domain-containing protein [Burkholderiales bacterium]MEB2347168.1 2Fe-2S iron-sulfur cluster-binding protein [Comamonadaceae bacterium]
MDHQIKLHPSGQRVAWGEGLTALEALERAGYALPNNCRAGACGECKVKVRSGEFDQGFVLDMALSQEERANGCGLMCMAKPVSEVLEIEWGTEDAKPKLFPVRDAQYAVLIDRIPRTPRITEFVLRPLGDPMRFWPGQFIKLGDPSQGAPMRSYSLAGAPQHDGELRLQVTRVDAAQADSPEGRTSRWLHDTVQLGQTLRFSGPHGTFIGDPSVNTPVLCLAAGSGLAPILSLAEAALRRGYAQPVTLMFSARSKDELYDVGLMRYWEARHPNFHYLPTTTREEAPGIAHGRIPAILAQHFPDLAGYSVFVAGTPGFVDDCVEAAKRLGATDALIHTEGFYEQL